MISFEQILSFAYNTSNICFTDYIKYKIHEIDYFSVADYLVKSVFKVYYQNEQVFNKK